MSNHYVIQLPPDQYDLITTLLAAEKVESVFPREKWTCQSGRPLGDGPFLTPILAVINQTIYCDADNPYVNLYVGIMNNGRATLVAASSAYNPERSIRVNWSDRHDLKDKFVLDHESGGCSLEFRRAIRTEHDVLISVDEHGRPLKDAPARYDQSARNMAVVDPGIASEHLAPQPTYDLSVRPCSQPGQSLLQVNRIPSLDKHEYVSVQLPTEFAQYLLSLHEAKKPVMKTIRMEGPR